MTRAEATRIAQSFTGKKIHFSNYDNPRHDSPEKGPRTIAGTEEIISAHINSKVDREDNREIYWTVVETASFRFTNLRVEVLGWDGIQKTTGHTWLFNLTVINA